MHGPGIRGRLWSKVFHFSEESSVPEQKGGALLLTALAGCNGHAQKKKTSVSIHVETSLQLQLIFLTQFFTPI